MEDIKVGAYTQGEWLPTTDNTYVGARTSDGSKDGICKIMMPLLFNGKSEAECIAERDANAKLIAAAPKLAESLIEMLRIVEEYRALGKLKYEQELAYHKAATVHYKATK